MADLTVTAANVVAGTDSVFEYGVLGATVTAGQVLYKDTTASDVWKLADNNGATALIRTPVGIALNGGSSGQPVKVHKSGSYTSGATMTAGLAYYLSDTPGGLCPIADVGAGEYVSFIGVATSTTVLKVNITVSGVSN